jgi:hypothetical protein
MLENAAPTREPVRRCNPDMGYQRRFSAHVTREKLRAHVAADMPPVAANGRHSGIVDLLREHQWLVRLVIGYIAVGYATQWWSGRPGMIHLALYSEAMFVLAVCFCVGFLTVHAGWWMLRVRHDESLLTGWWQDLRTNYFTRWRAGCFFVVFLVLTPFADTFGSFKQALPELAPFAWDVRLMELDGTLHGGVHPWEWLQPVVGHPPVTYAIAMCYTVLWFFVMFGVVLWQAWSANRWLRKQFFLSYVLIWIVLGTLLAARFSSAGPCYFEKVTDHDNPYRALMAYLNGVNDRYPLPAIETQKRLWDNYVSGKVSVVGGISAMPSLHVGTAVLFALLGWRTNRWLGAALTLFAVVILIGSVHLAWHYAIDGYVAAILTVVIWRSVGWAIRNYYPGYEPAAA